MDTLGIDTAAMRPATMEVSFSFLVSGPTFRVTLPDYFDRTPEMNTPLFNGIGGRDFTFIPASRDVPAEGTVLLRSLTDLDGREVELIERIEPPPLWWLRWSLSAGALYTHLREEDGVEMADVTVASISIVETSEGLPFILPDPPLTIDMVQVNDFLEETTFFSNRSTAMWSAVFRRPGFLPPGSIQWAPTENTDGRIVIVEGLTGGVEVMLAGGESLAQGERLATMVLESFSES